MKTLYYLILLSLIISCAKQEEKVIITVDASQETGEFKPIWAWFGYDEPNYTYMENGKKLLHELSELSPVPVYVRTHNLMTTGDGTPALKWGSTNMYTEDDLGNPIYNWQIVDSIFDTFINLNMKPLAEIGFMPEALSSNPEPYKHNWDPADENSILWSGWAYPPNDYEKWAELIYQWVTHCVERYGKDEVESWYWQVWNEPNIPYLQDENQLETFCKMHDYAADAVKRALPTAKVGGPHIAGANHEFLTGFIKHCLEGKNAATGETGAPLDFLAFHAKGSPNVVNDTVVMGIKNQIQTVDENLMTISSIPEVKDLPIIIGESDPEGCAACGMNTHPANAYRNGTMYSSYTSASLARIYELNALYETNIIGALNWSFEFENQPWFHGFRSLATNGVDKPVLNVFRMLGMMKGNQIAVSSSSAYPLDTILQSGIRGEHTDINAMASMDENQLAVLVWNYHDKDIINEGSSIRLTLENVPFEKVEIRHYRIDDKHSNSYEVWKNMGSPQNPTAEQIQILEESGQLEMFSKPEYRTVSNHQLSLDFQLPRQGVSLVVFELK